MVAINRILCPVDLSPCSRTALRYASALARWYEAPVTALHVFQQAPVVETSAAALGGGIYSPPLALADVDRAALTRTVAQFVADTPDAAGAEVHVREGFSVREEILREAAALPADLLVLGSHGLTGVKRLVLGSTAENVLRHATTPTLIVPAHAPDVPASGVPFKRIVCAVDFEAESYRAVRYALDLAQESDAQLTLLHAVEMPTPQLGADGLIYDSGPSRETLVADARNRLEALVPESARSYCTVHVEVVEGRTDEVILRFATTLDADLIIMGVRDRSAFDVAVFGSHAQAVVRASHCPVLTVHQE